ncbi:M20/M25/M40 family metallo-hydrolase [Parageobacillus thermoglucosidasius]|uniref:M20/M25/M40 family metallo-hydrolase n=1 Tax=Parageobacillus thermoglucosidasius TaxID=1426 RepID=UPI0001D18E5E|nr:M20/M25/M40 family metallo-hydrolase [Parageobacillus thermoglucosidasius]AEH47525.1 peptidase M20 [Parageobacillus thermoglucosidasius C56-YS93]MED4905575.1 M20/M25/M40 family metallo-hydrolase [Parageobacillus thermoglucosidasius]MED4913961.1 M20/M25/M40 family metallo-hydrolase [Parageobacillus thermoglucosidasius]MED4945804.1 M20/M25/M40 family metallo-hydrolase [Parageobacillus thermoglucosidasius]MED4981267.1 M20/M25/M40 family metallo-hydrolase [Parageobacillus thermoglucosidasius]
MEKLTKLMIRHGLHPKDAETGITSQWLMQTFATLIQRRQHLDGISETDWIEALQQTAERMIFHHRDIPGKETLVDPRKDDLPLIQIDPYVRGIVRWLNMMHIYTVNSCDGEGRRPARIDFLNDLSATQASIIRACTPKSVHVKLEKRRATFFYKKGQIADLLTIAERLNNVWRNPESLKVYRLEKLKQRLMPLLRIQGESGREHVIRQWLHRYLRSRADWLKTDEYGNLLAAIHCGEGPVIALSAHMDTVKSFHPYRTVIENGTTLKSSSGILGADDRAGIAVILEIIDFIRHSRFQGTLKIAFTVQEEIGCLGSRHIDPAFLQDIDAAIVVDRRGTRDIVTSYAGIVPFCPDEYGRIFETAGALAGMPDWKITAGGLSDAKTFAEFGIPSVNLSVGYEHEHTELETLDCKATLETVLLLETVFENNMIAKKLVATCKG